LAQEISAFRVKKITFPSSGERYVIIEGRPHGIALEAPSIYTSMCLRENGLSPNSMAQHLRAIVLLLRWATEHSIDLDQRLQSVQLLSTDEMRRNLNLDKVSGSATDAGVRSTVRHGHYYSLPEVSLKGFCLRFFPSLPSMRWGRSAVPYTLEGENATNSPDSARH
jgi:hypothetical protein